MNIYVIVMLLGGLFCLVRAAFDLRAGRYVWAALGLIAGLAILLTPVPQSIPLELQLPAAGRQG
ncbi:hypothetical protein [Sphingobium sp. EM0848]|uniref:hypothetical protein n=1 Tax=Sphingobium sp. EM0848 TaxID=2743473 RepID=UPI00159CB19A|nr:hypothetical protein [Sphingobium sp. EM0848]